MANCPQCGRPLTRDKGRSRYFCENEGCPVVYVRSPDNPFRKKVAFTSSARETTIKRIEEATAQEIMRARTIRLSRI